MNTVFMTHIVLKDRTLTAVLDGYLDDILYPATKWWRRFKTDEIRKLQRKDKRT